MQSLFKTLSVIFHPVFIPLYVVAVFLNYSSIADEARWYIFLGWIVLVALMLPGVYLKLVRSEINVFNPNIEGRTSIYRLFLFVNIILAMAFLLMEFQLGLYFVCASLLFFVLLIFSKLKLKASWHMAGWAQLLLASLIVYWIYPFNELKTAGIIVLLVLSLLYVSRLQLKAHTKFELLIGLAIGIITSTPLLFV